MVEETSLVYLSPSPLSPSPHEEGLPLAGMSAPTALQRVISANSAMNSASRLWEEEENDVPTDLDSILEESSTLVAHGGEGEGEGEGEDTEGEISFIAEEIDSEEDVLGGGGEEAIEGQVAQNRPMTLMARRN